MLRAMSEESQHFEGGVEPKGWLQQSVYYPDEYLWLVLVGTLDIMCTTVILMLGGYEVNPIADRILQAAGISGMVFFKFAAISVVVCICEYIARHRPTTARRLARFAVAISAVPVALGALQLFIYFYVVPLL